MQKNNVNSERTFPDSILSYTDYREFLADRWEQLKTKDSRLSFESASRKLKTSRSYLKMIISKKRHLSQNKIMQVAEIFKLNPFEVEYFFLLFMICVTEEAELKTYLRRILERYQISESHRDSPVQIKTEHRRVFDVWPRLLLFNLVRLKDFQFNLPWLKRRLASPAEPMSITKKVMNELIHDEIVTQDATGYKARNFVFSRAKPYEGSFAKTVTATFFAKAMEANERDDLFSPGATLCSLMPLSKTNHKMVLEKCIEFEKSLWAISTSDPAPEDVYLRVSYLTSLTKGSKLAD